MRDLMGQRFGRLTVIGRKPGVPGEHVGVRWICECECGAVKTVLSNNLTRGNTTSCGNLKVHRPDRSEIEDEGETFEAIGEAIGSARQVARNVLESALRKIRNNPELLTELLEHR